MIKAVFFDAIDTLFGPYPDKIGMYCRVIKKTAGFDVSPDKMKQVWDKIVINTEEKAARMMSENGDLAWDGFNQKILELLDYQGDLKTAGKKLLYEAWSNPENFVLYDDVIDTLVDLENKGIIIACVSNENSQLNNFFVHFAIDKYFKFIMTSEEEGVEKPNPKIFKHALNRLNLEPKEAIHVGDSLISDYYGAEHLGLKAILIDRDDKFRDNKKVEKIQNLTEVLKYI
ncbi:MAG: HAD-IA family hydrolase [Patescibacteria group bacterium]|jgi:REG-2-like HAD superfamily hydrolase